MLGVLDAECRREEVGAQAARVGPRGVHRDVGWKSVHLTREGEYIVEYEIFVTYLKLL